MRCRRKLSQYKRELSYHKVGKGLKSELAINLSRDRHGIIKHWS